MNKSTSLAEFGYNFLGPICATYMRALIDRIAEVKPSEVLFLAREGYLLQNAFTRLTEMGKVEAVPHMYLLASRTFLFRICIGDPTSWQWSLSHKFNGSLEQLLLGRFGFSFPQVEHVFSVEELAGHWELPAQQAELEVLLRAHLDQLKQVVAESRANYLEYLKSKGLSAQSRPLMVDVGYSGTIQKLLTLLLNAETQGLYFITTRRGEYQINGTRAHMECVFKDGVKMGEGYTMLDRSLLLESLLTSPNGQFVDIRRSAEHLDRRFDFYFGRLAYSQRNFHELEQVFDGALEAIVDAMRHGVTYSLEEIEQLYERYAYDRKLIPRSTWALFDVDDAISGHGNVNPLQLFGL